MHMYVYIYIERERCPNRKMRPPHVLGVLSTRTPKPDPTRPCWREPSLWLVAQPSKSAAHRDNSREWNVSKQKWNIC